MLFLTHGCGNARRILSNCIFRRSDMIFDVILRSSVKSFKNTTWNDLFVQLKISFGVGTWGGLSSNYTCM